MLFVLLIWTIQKVQQSLTHVSGFNPYAPVQSTRFGTLVLPNLKVKKEAMKQR
jgi:hypothetical protein